MRKSIIRIRPCQWPFIRCSVLDEVDQLRAAPHSTERSIGELIVQIRKCAEVVQDSRAGLPELRDRHPSLECSRLVHVLHCLNELAQSRRTQLPSDLHHKCCMLGREHCLVPDVFLFLLFKFLRLSSLISESCRRTAWSTRTPLFLARFLHGPVRLVSSQCSILSSSLAPSLGSRAASDRDGLADVPW